MVEVYGGVVGNWRVHVTADIINQDNRTATIRAITYFQAINSWNYSAIGGDFGISVNGQGNTYSSSNGITVGANQQQNVVSIDVTVSKGHGDTSIPFNGYINIHGYASGSSSATGYISIGTKPSWTVSYNANGGSGAPGNQTRWYDETINLSNQRPTRPNYEFLGWATSSNGGVAYTPGARFAQDGNQTLYAVWKQSFVAPTITSISAWRSDSSGVIQADGSYAKIEVKWRVDNTIDTNNIGLTMKISGDVTSSDNISGLSGTFTKIFSDIDTARTYTFVATLADKHLSASSTATIGPAFYLMDMNPQGTGIGFGQPAPDKGVRMGGTFFASQLSQLTTNPIYKNSHANIENGEEYIMNGNGEWILYNTISPLHVDAAGLLGGIDYVIRAGVAFCSVDVWYTSYFYQDVGQSRDIIAKGLMPIAAVNMRTFVMTAANGSWDRRFNIQPHDDGRVTAQFMNKFELGANEHWKFGFSYPLGY
jgi:uncharacterized repeat protein (TIGR02543 family)